MKDLQQTMDGDLALVGSDILWGESTYQHQRDLLLQRPGDSRLAPWAAVDVENYLNDDEDGLYRQIRTVFATDGMTVNSIKLELQKIKIDAPYKND